MSFDQINDAGLSQKMILDSKHLCFHASRAVKSRCEGVSSGKCMKIEFM